MIFIEIDKNSVNFDWTPPYHSCTTNPFVKTKTVNGVPEEQGFASYFLTQKLELVNRRAPALKVMDFHNYFVQHVNLTEIDTRPQN